MLLTNGGIIKCFSATNVYTIARELDLLKVFNAYKELSKFLPVTPMESHKGLLIEKLVNGVSLNKVDADIQSSVAEDLSRRYLLQLDTVGGEGRN